MVALQIPSLAIVAENFDLSRVRVARKSGSVPATMITRSMMRKLSPIVLPLMLGGCAIGNSEYGCPGMPGGVMCASVRDVYEMTGRGETTSQTDMPPHAGRAEYMPEVNGDVIPLRTPAKIMRIWINAWEAKNNDLQVPGFVYTEIEPRRWQIGLPAAKQPAELILLEPRPSSATPAKSAGGAPTPATKKSSSPPSKPVSGDR